MKVPTNSIAHRDCCIGVSFPLVALEKYPDWRKKSARLIEAQKILTELQGLLEVSRFSSGEKRSLQAACEAAADAIDAYDAAAPEVYNQDDDIMTGTPWCMPWMTGAMGAEKGDTPESLGRKAACMDYRELESLFGPDEEGLAAKTEAAVLGFLLDGLALPEFLKPEGDILDKAAAEIAEARERGMDDDEAERLISEIVSQCIAEVTPRVAMRRAR